MGYSGQNSYSYWGNEGTALAGDPSSDQNIPFNPIAQMVIPEPRHVDEEFHTFDKLTPHAVYSKELAPDERAFEMLFKDPFTLASFFTHKVVGGTWVAGTGTLAYDFTAIDDLDTIFVQSHLDDLAGANDVDQLAKGGLPAQYEWVMEPGELLKEIATYKFLNFATNVQAPTINNSFHDQAFGTGVGGWANWDDSGCNSTGKRRVADMALDFGGAITGLDIKSLHMTANLGYGSHQLWSSLSHTKYFQEKQAFEFVISGLLADESLRDEMQLPVCDRTPETLKISYDTAAGETKYVQCTNCFVSPLSSELSIPASGEPAEVDFMFKASEGFALTYAGNFLNLADPSALITA